MVLLADSESRTIGPSPSSAVGLNSVGSAADDVEGVSSGNRMLYPGVFGDGIDLEFESTYNGLKETITLDSSPGSSNDLSFSSELFFDAEAFVLASGNGEVTSNSSIVGDLYVQSAKGEVLFVLPRPFVMDSPRYPTNPLPEWWPSGAGTA